jgi:hypothetical protein
MVWLLAGLLVVVVAAIAWVLLRSRSHAADPAPAQQDAPAARPAPRRAPPTWGKTVLVPDPANACPAVLKIRGQALSNESAPRLPLADCTMADRCQCRFMPAPERRIGAERRSGTDRRTQLRFEPGKAGDRRSGKDRRHRGRYDWDHTI